MYRRIFRTAKRIFEEIFLPPLKLLLAVPFSVQKSFSLRFLLPSDPAQGFAMQFAAGGFYAM
jgi:hypothetical protein